MNTGERRGLVFTNLANGLPVARVMDALHLSEQEVLADFTFVAQKIRSYRFERLMRVLPVQTIEDVRANRVEAILTLGKMKLDKDPKYSRIETLPYLIDDGGRMSDAERAMVELRARAGAHK